MGALLEEHERVVRAELRDDAERSIRAWYLIEKIAKKEKVFATESDYEARIEGELLRTRPMSSACRLTPVFE